MNLDDLCQGIVTEIGGCLGCAVVDLDTGLPLAMDVVPGSSLNPAAMEYLSVASVDYFRGRTVWQLELEMSGGGASQAGFVREIQTTTADMHHFMAVVPGWESTLFVLVTGKTANLGMGWIAMRQALAQIAAMHEREQRASRSQNSRFQGVSAAAARLPDEADHGQPEQPSDQVAAEGPGQGNLRTVPEQSFDVKVPGWRGGHGARGRHSG